MDRDPLAELKPLLAPDAVGWWPPAPGWWLLAALLLLLLTGLLVWWWRRRRFLQRTRYRREALALLATVSNAADGHAQLHDIARILRRAAVSAWGREQTAHLPWPDINVLSASHARLDDSSLQLLSQAQYRRAAPTDSELAHLRSQAERWLQNLPPREH